MKQALMFPDLREKAVFSADRPQPQILLETDKLKAIVGGLVPGQQIPLHPEALGLYHFLEGTGWMTVDGERFAISPGVTVYAPEGAVRGMNAETRVIFLAVRVA
ncbi:MAG TPA: cupin domain-containing protein [Anaerolineae bacterium]